MSLDKDFTKIIPIDSKTANRFDQYEIINGINRLGDIINSIQRDMENRILLVLSIIISAIIGFFLAENRSIIALDLSLFMGVLLILSLIKETKDKFEIRKMLLKVYDNAIKNGIKLE